MSPDCITVSPDPLDAGKTGKVCYDFDLIDPTVGQVQLEIAWDPPQNPATITVTVSRSQPCVTIDVPKAARGVTIVDSSGNSADYQGTVTP